MKAQTTLAQAHAQIEDQAGQPMVIELDVFGGLLRSCGKQK
jgi:hypothetical protein